MLEKIQDEPVRFVAGIQASLAVAVTFGLPLTELQLSAVVFALASWLGFFVRNQVTPDRKLHKWLYQVEAEQASGQ